MKALAEIQVVPIGVDVSVRKEVTRAHERGGPRNSDRLLRWDPDQGEGVWNATEATELSG